MTEAQTLLDGRYRLLERIATGGMGVVWLGHDELLDRPVAVKQLHPQRDLPPAEAEVAARRAMREARLTARLHHPNIVTVFDVVEHDGRPCLIMQYLPSTSLQELLAEKGPLAPGFVARWGAELACALAVAHHAGIVHRDVKPGNVLIGEDGSPRLTDFGIAHALGDPSLTTTGIVTGTPAFLAPEAARGEPSGFAGDVFSLGATLYAAVEGHSPYGDDGNPMAVLHRAASGRIDRPNRAGPLTGLLLDMLIADQQRRPAVRDVARRLQAIADGTHSSPAADVTQRLTAPQRTVAPPMAGGVTSPMYPGGEEAVRRPVPPPPPVNRPLGDRAPRRRWPLVAAVLGVLTVIAVVAAVLASTSGSGAAHQTTARSTTAQSTTPRANSTASHAATPATRGAATKTHPAAGGGAPTGPSDESPAQAITDYYALLPDNTDAAWSRLTTSYQNGTAGGRASFDSFWAQMRSVGASGARSTGADTVEATITYVYRDGRTVDELTSFGLVSDGGVLKIDSSKVLSSSTR